MTLSGIKTIFRQNPKTVIVTVSMGFFLLGFGQARIFHEEPLGKRLQWVVQAWWFVLSDGSTWQNENENSRSLSPQHYQLIETTHGFLNYAEKLKVAPPKDLESQLEQFNSAVDESEALLASLKYEGAGDKETEESGKTQAEERNRAALKVIEGLKELIVNLDEVATPQDREFQKLFADFKVEEQHILSDKP